MAATVSVWAKPGAWALDSEKNEASELLHQQLMKEEAPAADFPSLSTAAATKTKKKSKGQTVSLQEFSTFGSSFKKQPTSYQAPSSKGLTHDEIMALPTGPRERSAEELDRSKGFRSYGTSSFDRSGDRDEPRRQRDSNRDLLAPSRADETDDWGAAKKLTAGNGFERRERRESGERVGFFSDSQSRADDVDNWASNKRFVPTENRRPERRVGFESNGGADNSDNWTKRKEEDGRKFGAFDSLRERRGVGFDSSNGPGAGSESWGRKREEVSGGGGGERPRLNLQPRTLPVGDKQQENDGGAAKPRGTNPFGDARPRDEVLKEKGQDPKEIEEKLEFVKVNDATKPKGSNPFGDARPREEVLKEKGQDPKEIEENLESLKAKEVAGSDVPPAPGSGNWRGGLPHKDKTERAWRKPEPVDACPPSDDKTEEEPVEKDVDNKDPQM